MSLSYIHFCSCPFFYYYLNEEIQQAKPKILGEDKLLVMMGDIHIEMAFMKFLGVILFVVFLNLGVKISWYQHFKCP